MIHYDYLIVGSGLFGATFAHLAKKQGKTCLIIDKRRHLGGNIYCEQTEGINVHKYGAHIFHTSNKDVWDFVNSIIEFNRYTNSPVANYKGKLYNLPFNMNTFYQMWGVTTPEEAQAKIEEQRAEAVARMKADGVTEPRNLEEQAQLLIGKDIYERLIKDYTEKQWGRECKDLPAFIIKRLPVRMVFDNNYFNDKYQGIPIGGYNKLIEGLGLSPTLPRREGGYPAADSYHGEGDCATVDLCHEEGGCAAADSYHGEGGYPAADSYHGEGGCAAVDLCHEEGGCAAADSYHGEGGCATVDLCHEEGEGGKIDCLVGIDIPLNKPKHPLTLEKGGYRQTASAANYNLLEEKAKEMRKNPTDGESAFWRLAADKALGTKFRRQHVIDNYIVDFVSLEGKLIVEIDGGYHKDSQQMILDNQRSDTLKDYGFTILRLQNEEVIADPEQTLAKVRLALWLAAQAPLREGFREAFGKLVYTGAIDEFYDYKFGRLDWRTVSFKTRIENTPNYQGNAVVNYTSHDEPFTRVIEHKHFEMFGQEVFDCPKTVISEEYSTEYKPGMEPYYPVNDERNNAMAKQYRQLAAQEQDIIFGGRLAEYKYYDMAPIIEQAMKYFNS